MMSTIDRCLLFVCCGYAFSAFGYGTAIAGTPLAELRQTMAVLERGENALSSSSVDLHQALKSVLEALPPDSQDFVRTDIATFLRRVPEKGADFNCAPDFMRYRARQELGRIKDKLLNTSPQPAEPQFCYAVPFVIDLAQPPENLEIYGYDLDTQPLELFLLNKDGSFEDASFALTRKTHYHLTADLGPNGVKVSPHSQMVSIAWGHIVRYSVSLIQATTDLCSSQIEEIPEGKTITFSPLRISGAGRLGSGRNVRADVMLNYESNKVDATVCIMATDQERDPTTFGGCAVEYVYTTDAERVIDGVITRLETRTSQVHLSAGENIVAAGRDGPVSKWVFDVPGAQSKAAVEPMVTVTLRRIRIASTKPDNCLPVIAYLEARRRNALAPGTLKRLDPESRTIQREILELRPRFAPRQD
jgi:hypothetical protein